VVMAGWLEAFFFINDIFSANDGPEVGTGPRDWDDLQIVASEAACKVETMAYNVQGIVELIVVEFEFGHKSGSEFFNTF
jgi:hypothetical protein